MSGFNGRERPTLIGFDTFVRRNEWKIRRPYRRDISSSQASAPFIFERNFSEVGLQRHGPQTPLDLGKVRAFSDGESIRRWRG
jgi:hypothetical protein